MRIKLFYFLFTIGVLLIFYLSWTSNPRLSITGILPVWVTDWTDTEQNETIRTGIPFLLLGLGTGIYLQIKKSSTRYWVIAFMMLVLIVSLAELGQLFLPLRNCDLYDVFWGALGAGAGLLLIYPFKYLLRK